jgi:hypothetical protein
MPSTIIATEDRRTSVASLIRAEYREMPGLALTAAQLRRLWQLSDADAGVLIDTLVNSGFLRRTASGCLIHRGGCR